MMIKGYMNALCCSIAILSGSVIADTSEDRELVLSSKDLLELRVDATAGFLHLKGVEGASEIRVNATLVSDDFDNTDFTLSLEREGKKGVLLTKIDKRFLNYNAKIDLTVTVPKRLLLDIEDGSGEIKINNFANKVRVDDGSGSIELTDIAGELDIEDGSGKVVIENIGGDIRLDDGSGSIEISNVAGDVRVDDGSGSINLRDIDGRVRVDDGSGSINVDGAKSFTLIDDGSGSVNLSNIQERS